MRKGDPVDEVFITPTTSMQVYIDEDDVGMWRMCLIENGAQSCSVPQVMSMGPVTEIVCERAPEANTFVVAYSKSNGIACAKQGFYAGETVWWSDEVEEEPSYEFDLWALRN